MAEIVITTRKNILGLLIVLLATGCASLSNTRDAPSANSSRNTQDIPRAERVFRYQSRVANALFDRYPLLEVMENADPAVIAAEAQMSESCSALTQAVLTRFEGKKPSFKLRFRVITTVGDCERAARKVDKLLNSTAIADSF